MVSSPMLLTLRQLWNSSPLERRLTGGLVWTLSGTAASRGAVFLASFVLARLLGRSSFGEFGAIESTVGMFASFSNVGLAVAATAWQRNCVRILCTRAVRWLAATPRS